MPRSLNPCAAPFTPKTSPSPAYGFLRSNIYSPSSQRGPAPANRTLVKGDDMHDEVEVIEHDPERLDVPPSRPPTPKKFDWQPVRRTPTADTNHDDHIPEPVYCEAHDPERLDIPPSSSEPSRNTTLAPALAVARALDNTHALAGMCRRGQDLLAAYHELGGRDNPVEDFAVRHEMLAETAVRFPGSTEVVRAAARMARKMEEAVEEKLRK